MLKTKKIQLILKILIVIFPLTLAASLISNFHSDPVSSFMNFIDGLQLPSLIGTILTAILLKATNKKFDRFLKIFITIAIIVSIISISLIVFSAAVLNQWERSAEINQNKESFTHDPGY
jgi:hypothetical protein